MKEIKDKCGDADDYFSTSEAAELPAKCCSLMFILMLKGRKRDRGLDGGGHSRSARRQLGRWLGRLGTWRRGGQRGEWEEKGHGDGVGRRGQRGGRGGRSRAAHSVHFHFVFIKCLIIYVLLLDSRGCMIQLMSKILFCVQRGRKRINDRLWFYRSWYLTEPKQSILFCTFVQEKDITTNCGSFLTLSEVRTLFSLGATSYKGQPKHHGSKLQDAGLEGEIWCTGGGPDPVQHSLMLSQCCTLHTEVFCIVELTCEFAYQAGLMKLLCNKRNRMHMPKLFWYFGQNYNNSSCLQAYSVRFFTPTKKVKVIVEFSQTFSL